MPIFQFFALPDTNFLHLSSEFRRTYSNARTFFKLGLVPHPDFAIEFSNYGLLIDALHKTRFIQ